ncbi:MAG: indolepyruvate/phenylpyruvate decarboxylase [Hyphomicrobium sp.]
MKLAHALLSALKDYGAAEIFGIPGDFALPLFREIERTGILPLYTLSHEPAVGFAADSAARYRSSLSVAAVTYGAGGLNLINAAAQAYAEKSPVVFVSGAPGANEGQLGLGLHHQVKHLGTQLNIFREVTCAQAVLDDPATAPGEIARVLTAARELSRPVYIEFPRDLIDAECAPVPAFSPTVFDPEAVRAAAEETIERLAAAREPALLVCVEARRYGLEDKVSKLARRLAIPTATTFMARGILAGTGTPFIGTYLGLAGDDEVRTAIESSDALLMLGVILCDTNFGVSERLIDRRRSIHAVDRTVRITHHAYADVPLAAYVDELLDLARPLGEPRTAKPRPPPATAIRDHAEILPADVAAAVNDLFERHGRMPIAADMGDCLFTAMDIVYTELVAPAYYGTMGPGVPMGLGMEAASGRRTLIMVGDGAFQMTGWELGNAARLGLEPIVLVMNNAAWGMLKVLQSGTGYNDLTEWRFAEIAGPLGGVGQRVSTRSELADALEAAHADKDHWRLIEIMIPRGAYSQTLQRFVAAMKRRSVLGKG